ncbi:hypothetical protein LCGC14_2813870, partial [marine sediment metagenome]
VINSGNFSINDVFEISYYAPLSRKVDLGQNLLLLLQDSEGNDVPIDLIPIEGTGLFKYNRLLRTDSLLSLPLGGGKKLVHMTLSFLPQKVYNKSADQFVNITYKTGDGNIIYPYKESNKWAKPFTIVTYPKKVKLTMVDDFTQDMAIEKEFIEEREYIFNQDPAEALEAGEEYTRVSIDALVKEDYEFTFQLLEYEDELDFGTPRKDSIVWLQIGLMPKSKTKFLNTRALIKEYGVNPYFESLGTEEVTFRGPGTSAIGANKMFGRPLTYELGHQYSDYNAYGPYVWQWAKTDRTGKVTFNVSFNKDFLDDFTEIFGVMEGFNSVEDIVLYIRAFSSNFDWDDFAIDSPNQYIGSKDGDIYDGSSRLENYDFADLKLQDGTYLEGLINLHKKDIALGTNDYYSYE